MSSRKTRTGAVLTGIVVALTPLAAAQAVPSGQAGRPKPAPVAELEHIVFAHRGASGYRPEHTIAAYKLAIRQCADYIEPDLVMTRDGVLVDRHEPEIGGTTDVADRPQFAGRKRTKVVDGTSMTGWFTEDFTLKELKTLRAKERLPEIRPANTAYDGRYQVPTFDEVLKLAKNSTSCSGRPIGVIPEIKHSTYFANLGLPQEDKVVRALRRNGFWGAKDPVIIQSFEVSNLQYLHKVSDYNLVQLIDCQGAPADKVAAGDPLTYKDMVTDGGLGAVAKYATSVGYCKNVMIPRNPDGTLGQPTNAIKLAHQHGLKVTGWTFRRENSFLPKDFQSSTNPAAIGDLAGEIRVFLDAGMDHIFSDNPDVAAKVVRNY